jgi:hypothetical protein
VGVRAVRRWAERFPDASADRLLHAVVHDGSDGKDYGDCQRCEQGTGGGDSCCNPDVGDEAPTAHRQFRARPTKAGVQPCTFRRAQIAVAGIEKQQAKGSRLGKGYRATPGGAVPER